MRGFAATYGMWILLLIIIAGTLVAEVWCERRNMRCERDNGHQPRGGDRRRAPLEREDEREEEASVGSRNGNSHDERRVV